MRPAGSTVVSSRTVSIIALASAVLGGGLLGGCQSDMTATAPSGSLVTPGAPVSFVAIQGPSPELAQKFESVLSSEARRRGFSVVAPGQADSALRIRTYLDAYVSDDGKTGFAWVLDTSENGKTRAARIKGAAAMSAPANASWSALDETAMRQIAQMSVDDLVRHIRADASGTQQASASAETAE